MDKSIIFDSSKDDGFGIEKRVRVMKAALMLETEITYLLKLYLNVDESILKRGVQALGNQSNNIPFISKLWLLHDIGVLNDGEVKTLKALMEIRNKFLHVLECKSFEDAVNIENRKLLLKLNDIEDSEDVDLESKLENGFYGLIDSCLEIILKKIERKQELINEKIDTLNSMNNMLNAVIESDEELIKTLLNLTFEFKSDNRELEDFAALINKTIAKHQREFWDSDKLKMLQQKVKQIQEENRIYKLIHS